MTSDYSRLNPQIGDLVTRTWHVKRETAAEIAQIAAELGVGNNALVRYLLSFALAELRSGRLTLRTEPRRWRLLDFDDE